MFNPKYTLENWLVVEPTHLKNMLVKLDIFPKFRGENEKIFETNTWKTNGWKAKNGALEDVDVLFSLG